jgi:hypothetical protein
MQPFKLDSLPLNGASSMLLGNISLKQTHLILKDVDGSEVSVTLEDALDLYTFIKVHLQEIEERQLANWQEFLASIDRPDQTRSSSVQ